MFVEPGIVDANVLAYAANADDPKYAVSRALLDAARDPSITLYVTPQILCEFYSVITNPRRVAAPSSPAVALQVVSALVALPGISVLPITARAEAVTVLDVTGIKELALLDNGHLLIACRCFGKLGSVSSFSRA